MGEKAVRIFILLLAATFRFAFSDGGAVRSEPPSLGRGLPAFQATASAQEKGSDSLAAPTPAGELTLYQAYALVLLHNPELASYSWELRIREAEKLQAGLRLNPEVSLDVEDFAGTGAHTGVKSSQTTLQIGQTLELGGKRSARRNVATRQLVKAGWEYEAKRLEILKGASLAYVEVVGAQRGLSPMPFGNPLLASSAR